MRRAIRYAAGALLAAAALSASAPAAGSVTKDSVRNTVKRFERMMQESPLLSEKLASLRALKARLAQQLAALDRQGPVSEHRELRLSLLLLRDYLSRIDEAGFSPDQCGRYRHEIFLGFNPRGSDDIEPPEEAAIALRIQSSLCSSKKKAEPPSRQAPPMDLFS